LNGYKFDKDTVVNWLHENKYGYYSVLTTGVDFSETELINEMEDAGIIEKEAE
jgi:hypothetical protein